MNPQKGTSPRVSKRIFRDLLNSYKLNWFSNEDSHCSHCSHCARVPHCFCWCTRWVMPMQRPSPFPSPPLPSPPLPPSLPPPPPPTPTPQMGKGGGAFPIMISTYLKGSFEMGAIILTCLQIDRELKKKHISNSYRMSNLRPTSYITFWGSVNRHYHHFYSEKYIALRGCRAREKEPVSFQLSCTNDIIPGFHKNYQPFRNKQVNNKTKNNESNSKLCFDQLLWPIVFRAIDHVFWRWPNPNEEVKCALIWLLFLLTQCSLSLWSTFLRKIIELVASVDSRQRVERWIRMDSFHVSTV